MLCLASFCLVLKYLYYYALHYKTKSKIKNYYDF